MTERSTTEDGKTEEDLGITIDASREKDAETLAFESLYRSITSKAREEDERIGEMTTGGDITINDDPDYTIRINPAIKDLQGNLEILTISLYHEGVHVQQVTAKATWGNGVPEVIKIDSDPIEGLSETLCLDELAFHAESIINRPSMDFDADIPKGAIFPLPLSVETIN